MTHGGEHEKRCSGRAASARIVWPARSCAALRPCAKSLSKPVSAAFISEPRKSCRLRRHQPISSTVNRLPVLSPPSSATVGRVIHGPRFLQQVPSRLGRYGKRGLCAIGHGRCRGLYQIRRRPTGILLMGKAHSIMGSTCHQQGRCGSRARGRCNRSPRLVWATGTDESGGSDHGHGCGTLYAHLSGFAVIAGQDVRRGDILGLCWFFGPQHRLPSPALRGPHSPIPRLIPPSICMPPSTAVSGAPHPPPRLPTPAAHTNVPLSSAVVLPGGHGAWHLLVQLNQAPTSASTRTTIPGIAFCRNCAAASPTPAIG